MRKLSATVLAAVALLGIAGCGSARDGLEPARRVTSTHEPTFTTPITTPATTEPSGLRTTSIDASCGDEPWAFGFTPVEPALGNRYLSVQVRNCASQPATVPARPKILVTDADGKVVAFQWDRRPATTGLTVRPQQDVWLHLHWSSSGRCERGGAGLDVVIGRQTAHLADCLQLGGLSGTTGEPAEGDATWAAGR